MSRQSNMHSKSPCVWNVWCERHATYSRAVLTYRLLFPEDRTPQFDEQDICPPDAESGDDDRMMMEAFLALIPPDALVSCAIENLRRRFFLFQQIYYQHVFARYDINIVAATFEGRLWNSGTGVDFLFIGGATSAHTTDQIVYWSEQLEQRPDRYNGDTWTTTVARLLSHYERVIYIVDTVIYALMQPDPVTITGIRSSLGTVAARYGLMLPEDEFFSYR